MTDKELRKLSRSELLTLLIEVTEENERLSEILLRRGLPVQTGDGSSAEEGVADDVQGVFQSLESTAVGFLKEARDISDQIILEAQERADQMIAQAKQQAEQITGRPVEDDIPSLQDPPGALSEETSVTAGQTEAVLEAVGEVRPPDADAMELPWRARESEEEAETPAPEEEEEAAVEEEATEAEAEAAVEEDAAEAEAEEAVEEETEAEVHEIQEVQDGLGVTVSEVLEGSLETPEEEAFELPWLKKEQEVPAEPEVSAEQEVPAEPEVSAEPEAPAEPESQPAPVQEAAAVPQAAAVPETPAEPEPAPAPQKPLTAIDMLRMMQQGGGK